MNILNSNRTICKQTVKTQIKSFWFGSALLAMHHLKDTALLLVNEGAYILVYNFVYAES